MEIPDNLKVLYKHWDKHTLRPDSGKYSKDLQNVGIDGEKFNYGDNSVIKIITKRQIIWEKRQLSQSPPFTTDPILSQYKFCNIYRELDRQTIEIHTLLKPLENDFDLWLLNLVFCRMVCRVQTIKDVGFLNFNESNNKNVYDKLINHSRPKFGDAYIFPISIIAKTGYKTREDFFCFYLPIVIKKCTAVIQNFDNNSVTEALMQVLPVFGVNFKFHWTECFIDIAYQYPRFVDLFKEFPIGPGSIPTMKLLNPKVAPGLVNLSLVGLELNGFPYLTFNGRNVWLSAENFEGIGCEFRKYTNLVKGEGRKRKYNAIIIKPQS